MSPPPRTTAEQVREAVARAAPALGIPEWTVGIEVRTIRTDEPRDAGLADTAAFVTAEPDRRRAHLTVDPERTGPDELADNVRHELLHVVLADGERIFRAARALAQTPRESELLEVVIQETAEGLVSAVERLLDHGLGISAADLVKGRGPRWVPVPAA